MDTTCFEVDKSFYDIDSADDLKQLWESQFDPMPTNYRRKGNCPRAIWTEEMLQSAIQAVRSGNMGVNEASRQFDIPCTTLRRRLARGHTKKQSLGPSSVLGVENERKIVLHIKQLQKGGFAPTRKIVRQMAYQLAEQLQIKHTFNKETKLAGGDWLRSCLRRNPDLCVRKSEGVSLARARGMNKQDVDAYFDLLGNTLKEHSLFDKPGNIFNMDETGLQLNNRPEHVIAEKGSKNVTAITSGEKGETITAICCCNGEGTFIPPACILKGKNKKAEYEDGMPPGSVIYMSEKSAYINTSIFLTWLQTQFVPRKPQGRVILILDGHASHCSSIEVLEYADANDITLLCLPSHTTQFLQPLDRGFFKAHKTLYYAACNNFIRTNPTRALNRLQFGKLLAEAWTKSATVNNATSSFRATGIIPFNREAIPEYAFLIQNENGSPVKQAETDKDSNLEITDERIVTEQGNKLTNNNLENVTSSKVIIDPEDNKNQTNKSVAKKPEEKKETPGKRLDTICPVPSTTKVNVVRNRSRQLAEIITSPENILKKKTLLENKINSCQKRKKDGKNRSQKTPKNTQPEKIRNYSSSSSDSDAPLEEVRNELVIQNKKKDAKNDDKTTKKLRTMKGKTNKFKDYIFSSSDSEITIDLQSHSNSNIHDNDDETECVGCGEIYINTTSQEDWLQCVSCHKWLHESCTTFPNYCLRCGRRENSKV